jgi:hypothetical protein
MAKTCYIVAGRAWRGKDHFCFVARDLLLAEGSWKPGFGVIHGGERGLHQERGGIAKIIT